MSKGPEHHIEAIFDALDVGLDGITEAPGNSFKQVENDFPGFPLPMPASKGVGTITIDGHLYQVTVEAVEPA